MSLTAVSTEKNQVFQASGSGLSVREGAEEEWEVFDVGAPGRAFIRHPAQVPIRVSSNKSRQQLNLLLNNVSTGGLSFHSPDPFNEGTPVQISIPTKPVFQVHAIVQWCQPDKAGYELGVKFLDHADAYRVRMVEQVCHIEDYRLRKQVERGKRVSRNQASREWIAQHGGSFPG